MKSDIWSTTVPAELASLAAPERSPLHAAKVMMVDDEPLMTDLIQTHLEEEGYVNFVVSNDPMEAIDLLRREEPGVLLLDLKMPRRSGFEVLEAIRADRALRYTPVIVLTAETSAEAKLRALQLGATDFLSKPVDASELVLRVRNTLAFQQYHDRLVNFDAATGLPKQPVFARAVDERLGQRAGDPGLLAWLAIGVPECRQLRESVDAATADALARVVASRLERVRADLGEGERCGSTGRGARVARFSDDEFALVLEGLCGADAAESAAKQVAAVLSEPASTGIHEITPSPWIGIALAPGDGNSAEALHKSASLAASHCRTRGATPYEFASLELNAKSYERVALGSELRGAIQRRELCLHFQPKVELKSGRIVGAEALVRWNHATRGLVPPGEFIPLAEELGLITTIGQWVLETACRAAAGWSRAGFGAMAISVNVAKPQFMTGGLCAAVRQALFDSGLPPGQLVLELTESMLMDDVANAIETMDELRALGVALSIDDFGTGYSSLSYLKRLPLDELKVDRSFIVDLPGREVDLAIVRAVVELGHSLGMSVTAEGLEHEAQARCLRELDCDLGQGFLFSRPVPEAAMAEILRKARDAC